MQSKVPLPTDNIYKFYALFGLFILFLCMLAFVTTYNVHTGVAFQVHEELQVLNKVEKPSRSQIVRKEVLERKEEINTENKKSYMTVISKGFTIAIILITFGFIAWHYKVQPLQDELSKKHIEKLDLELSALRKQARHRVFIRKH